MIRHLLIVLLVGALALFGFAGIAYAQLPFGGFNGLIIPCTAALPLYLNYYAPVGAYPPNLMGPPAMPFSYYAFLVPSAPIVGLYTSAAVPCLFAVPFPPFVIVIGVGFPIVMEGTGL